MAFFIVERGNELLSNFVSQAILLIIIALSVLHIYPQVSP